MRRAPLVAPTLDDVRAAQTRIRSTVLRTPLVRLNAEAGAHEIFLKLENLQPIGSFKLRGAANAMLATERDALGGGVYTASAGNMAQGVAWCSREFGVPCQVVVPEHAPAAKTDAIERLGGEVIKVPFDEWWQTILDHGRDGMRGVFVHPFADNDVMAGNATIGAEIFEDVHHHIDAVLVPFGGGGLACGVAAAVRSISPSTKVYAVEVHTAAPLTPSLSAGHPVTVTRNASFVDGMGSGSVSAEMWPLVQQLIDGTVVVTLTEIANAIRVLADRANVVAEGAGAAAVAAALSGRMKEQRVVCIVSGGNINMDVLASILRGETP